MNRQLYGFPLRSREGEIQVWSTGPTSREDIDTLIEVLRVGAGAFAPVAEVRTYFRCDGCRWEGAKSQLIPVQNCGVIGCPRCGARTTPLSPGLIRERISAGENPAQPKEPE